MEISGLVRIGLPPLREKNIRTVNFEHQVDTETQPGQLKIPVDATQRWGKWNMSFKDKKQNWVCHIVGKCIF